MRIGTGVGATLALVALAALPQLARAQDAGGQRASGDATIGGTVIDHDTTVPVTGAGVRLLSTEVEGQAFGPLMTNGQGNFAFTLIPAGSYVLEARMLGYQPRRDTLVIERGTEIKVTLELAVSPVALDPILVEVVSRPSYNMEQFDARKARLHGAFFDRKAIEDRFANKVSDLFFGLPAVSVVGGRPNNLRGGGGGFSSNRCPMSVYVDGIRTDQELDNSVPIDAMEAMEVYTSIAEVPVQYRAPPAACGVVLIWMRGQVAPDFAADRKPGTVWKGLLAVFGAMSLMWVATR